MIKILSAKKQNEVMRGLIEIILELRKGLPDNSAKDALDSAFQIALIVGGNEMLDAMTGKRSRRYRVGDRLSKGIELIDEMMDAFEK